LREQGKEEKALAIARNLLAKGWAIEEIAETAGLPIEKIRSLAAD
jgi:predicted transposase YdaD